MSGVFPRVNRLLAEDAVGVPAELIEHVSGGPVIRRRLRLVMVVFFVAVMISEPPARGATWCWLVVAGYLAWTLGVDVVARTLGGGRSRLAWSGLVVDTAVLAALTLITYATAAVSWTPYLLITGFFVVPAMAAAELNPLLCTIVSFPAVAVFLGTGLAIRHLDDEPLAYVLLRTFLLAAVWVGVVLLVRLQRSRVRTIGALLSERNTLLTELVSLQEREQRELAETLHDGVLQYVLAARQELDDAVDGDAKAAQRSDQALREASRLLRSTMSHLHPAVLEAAGLPAALADLVQSVRARGRLSVDLEIHDWDDEARTTVDGLILGTARELLTNVVKHASARRVRVELRRAGGLAMLTVTDDGVGMSATDIDTRLRAGHLGLASRRIRIQAAGGSIDLRAVQPHGTEVRVSVPVA